MDFTKEQFRNKLEHKIKEWSLEIDKLRLKAESSNGGTNSKYKLLSNELEENKQELISKLAKIKNTDDDTYKELKVDIELLYDDTLDKFSNIFSTGKIS